MNKAFIKDAFGWGFLLWLIGYVLGVIFFAFVPPPMIGWILLPVGILVTVWVLWRRGSHAIGYFAGLGVIWTLLAVLCDFLFIVELFKPADGYYKLDVYLYYSLTFVLPLIIGFMRMRKPA